MEHKKDWKHLSETDRVLCAFCEKPKFYGECCLISTLAWKEVNGKKIKGYLQYFKCKDCDNK